MLEEERKTQQLHQGFIKAHEITREVIDNAVESFAMNQDLDALLNSAREALQVARKYYPLAPISVASFYVDQLASSNDLSCTIFGRTC